MSERRFVLVDFTHMNRAGCLRLYEAGHTYALSRAIADCSFRSPELGGTQPGHQPPLFFLTI